MSLLELFCAVDDFWQVNQSDYQRQLRANNRIKRVRKTQLSVSEIMTIVIHFHQSSYRDFKNYYIKHVCNHLVNEFPNLVSYNRFVALMPRVGLPLLAYLQTCKGSCTGISFVDATSVAVCHNKRIARHKVFDGLAERGKTTMGWFYGFKLHLIVNEHGDLLAFQLTPGNVDDRKPLPTMAHTLFGKLFGDKGYISKDLFEQLWNDGLQLITMVRKNMKNQLVVLEDKLLSRKRSIIEIVGSQMTNSASFVS